MMNHFILMRFTPEEYFVKSVPKMAKIVWANLTSIRVYLYSAFGAFSD